MLEKFKSFIQNDQLFYGVLVILVAVGSFGLGRMSVSGPMPQASAAVGFSTAPPPPSQVLPSAGKVPVIDESPIPSMSAVAGEVVASKTGTKYHLPTCPGAKQIKPANLVTFSSIAEATAAGYTPAANCPGLK